jgi:predicted O-methyltransferase YrrM
MGIRARVATAAWAARNSRALGELVSTGDWRAFGIRTDVTREELLLLYELAKALSGVVAVEIGSYLGASANFIAAGCRRSNTRLYCIDTWQNEGMSEGLRDTYSEFVANTGRHHTRISAVRGLSTISAQTFAERIGLLFVDGDHSRGGVFGDLDAWLPHVQSEGWVVLHDSGWAEGVQAAITEVIAPIVSGSPVVLPNMFATRVVARGG